MKKGRKPEAIIRSALRMAWLRAPMRTQALKDARRSRGVYMCAKCAGDFGPKKIAVDHIIPCGKLTMDTIGEFAQKLFCQSDCLQVLCKPCHKIKTRFDRKMMVGLI